MERLTIKFALNRCFVNSHGAVFKSSLSTPCDNHKDHCQRDCDGDDNDVDDEKEKEEMHNDGKPCIWRWSVRIFRWLSCYIRFKTTDRQDMTHHSTSECAQKCSNPSSLGIILTATTKQAQATPPRSVVQDDNPQGQPWRVRRSFHRNQHRSSPYEPNSPIIGYFRGTADQEFGVGTTVASDICRGAAGPAELYRSTVGHPGDYGRRKTGTVQGTGLYHQG